TRRFRYVSHGTETYSVSVGPDDRLSVRPGLAPVLVPGVGACSLPPWQWLLVAARLGLATRPRWYDIRERPMPKSDFLLPNEDFSVSDLVGRRPGPRRVQMELARRGSLARSFDNNCARDSANPRVAPAMGVREHRKTVGAPGGEY